MVIVWLSCYCLEVSIISQTARPRRPVPVKELAEHCAHFHDNNNALFNDEFKVVFDIHWWRLRVYTPPLKFINMSLLIQIELIRKLKSYTFFWFCFQCLDRLAWKSTWEASQVPHNRTKNRYCNVVACKLKLLLLMQVLKRFSSWRPNGKVDELQHWTEQSRQQSRFNAVPTCCRVSHIISQIFMEFYIEYQEKPWL